MKGASKRAPTAIGNLQWIVARGHAYGQFKWVSCHFPHAFHAASSPNLIIFDLHFVLCYTIDSPAGHVNGLAHGASQHFTNGSWTKWRGCVSPYGQDGSV